jgi:hypothetical protein
MIGLIIFGLCVFCASGLLCLLGLTLARHWQKDK